MNRPIYVSVHTNNYSNEDWIYVLIPPKLWKKDLVSDAVKIAIENSFRDSAEKTTIPKKENNRCLTRKRQKKT